MYHRTEEAPLYKVEGEDVVCPDAIQITVGPEPQPARPLKLDTALRDEDAHELSRGRLVFAQARHGIWNTEGPFASDNDVSVWEQPSGREGLARGR